MVGYQEEVIMLGSAVVAAGTTEVKTAVVDMAGFDELEYHVLFGDNTSGSVVTITAKENTASSTTSPTPTQVNLSLGTSNTIAAVITSNSLVVTAGATDTDSKYVRVLIKRQAMTKRYQFLSVTPATQNAVIASITCIKRAAKALPVTQHADVISSAVAVG